MFDRVVVVSLKRRPDRLAAFQARASAAWPGQTIDVFPAVDGQLEERPKGWKSQPGAWGCYRSHQAIIERAIADGIERLLVLEDDCTFLPGFSDRLASLNPPADCQQLYLGGEHLENPKPAAEGFVRGTNVNRTHAYALLGRPALELVRDHLRWDPAAWTAKHHVDHHLGLLHRSGQIAVYAVQPWMCGQAAGTSDVDGANRPERAW